MANHDDPRGDAAVNSGEVRHKPIILLAAREEVSLGRNHGHVDVAEFGGVEVVVHTGLARHGEARVVRDTAFTT